MTKYNFMDDAKKADEEDAKAVQKSQAPQPTKKYNFKEDAGENWTWGDVGRAAAQGATLDYADEIAARAKSLMPGGKSYEEELKAQHESIDESKRRLGKGYDVANIAGGVATMFVPGLGLVRGGKVLAGLSDIEKARKLASMGKVAGGVAQAGDKLNKLGRTGRMAISGGALSAADDIGKQRGDINYTRAAGAGALGAGLGVGLSAGIGGVNAVKRVAGELTDAARGSMGMEASKGTVARALAKSAKALKRSGNKTGSDLDKTLEGRKFLQDAPNGQFKDEIAAPVQALTDPEFSRLARGAGDVTSDMSPIINKYERDALGLGAHTRSKAEIMKDDMLRAGGVDDTRTYLNRQTGELESLANQLDNFRASNAKQYVELPGLRRLFREQPTLAEDLWKRALDVNISRPGAPRIPNNILPVTPRQVQGWGGVPRGRVALETDGIPLGHAMNIRDAIRELMKTDPVRGQMVMEAILGRRIPKGGLVDEVNNLFGARRAVHQGSAAAKDARSIAGANSQKTAEQMSNVDNLATRGEFDNARSGYMQGLAHKMDDAHGDVRNWYEKNLGSSDQREAFQSMVHRPGYTGTPLEQIKHNVSTLSDRMNIVESLRKANKKLGSEAESQAVGDIATRYSYSPAVGHANLIAKTLRFLQRGVQLQNKEQVRIMLNTTREGRELIKEEMKRLGMKGSMGKGDVANIIANQLATTIWDKMNSGGF